MGVADSHDRVIDADGFRPNVGIIVCNQRGDVLWGRRVSGRDSWQFPQGGIHANETPEQAMFRELDEEVGLSADDVKVLGVTRGWHRYRLPSRYIRKHENPVCIGQKQKWFLLKLRCKDEDVDLLHTHHPEFDDWRWVSYWYPVRQVVSFKRDVYRRVMKEFAPFAMPFNRKEHIQKEHNHWRQRR